MIHLCFPYDFLGALIFHPISTTPGRCCYWRGATDATCTATCHGGQPWAKAVLVRDALFENVNVDFLFQPNLSTNLWNTVYFQHFFVWWPNRVRVPNYPKYQLSRGLVDGSGGEYFSSIPSNNLLEGIRPLPTPKLFINKSLQWIRVEEVTRFKAHPKSWLHIAVNSSIQLGSEPGRNLWKYRWANNGWFRDLSHPKSRIFIGEWVHIMEKKPPNHPLEKWTINVSKSQSCWERILVLRELPEKNSPPSQLRVQNVVVFHPFLPDEWCWLSMRMNEPKGHVVLGDWVLPLANLEISVAWGEILDEA